MSATFSIDTKNLRARLEALADDVRDQELGPIVAQTAAAFAADLPSRYPAVEGDLRGGVRLQQRGPLAHQVKNTARHAHLYEHGTIRRFTARAGAFRGVMPAQPVFVPWAIRWRARMVEAVANRLRALRVPGFDGTLGARES
jgi:hypothetical protein